MKPEPVSTEEFFRFIFGEADGYLCIATIDRTRGNAMKQEFFPYPDGLKQAIDFINQHKTNKEVYFTPTLLTEMKRRKKYVREARTLWADGDDCPIEELLLQPSAIIRTSKDRHAFFWKLNDVYAPEDVEEVNRRIAYYHADSGMDRSGWDLTQLLRVPDTYNHKYTIPQTISPAYVSKDVVYDLKDFDEYPPVEGDVLKDVPPLSTVEFPNASATEILEKHRSSLNPLAFDLFSEEPEDRDWSTTLWHLERMLFEGGLAPEEVFVIARASACNKYRRDGRADDFLWKEVLRAKAQQEEPEEPESDDLGTALPELLTDDEREQVKQDRTFVEMYTDWAKTLGDAAPQYHPVSALILLSTILSGNISLPTSFGTVIPNLWAMILADTTLTRKSTAMDIATDLLYEIVPDALLATDGSMEGMLTALSMRPGKPSMFLRDEFTGLIESMSRKDYHAGFMETLTKLYDGKRLKRVLRRETVDVIDPVLILFAGGIKTKMLDLLDYKHVSTGFLPRFIIITAEADLSRLKPVGPPTQKHSSERDILKRRLATMNEHYVTGKTSNDGRSVTIPRKRIAVLTEDAWHRYNRYEGRMLDYAIRSYEPAIVTPMMDRLAKSGLKIAVLLAATRKMYKDDIEVTELDIMHAFYYIEQWQPHTIYIAQNIGTTTDERKLRKIMAVVQEEPGILRSRVMQRFYLTAREADAAFTTLEQRAALRREKKGARSERLYPL